MIKQFINVDDVIVLLNDLIELDKSTIHALVETRVTCNDSIKNHPTVQVMSKDNVNEVGLIGIINGLFGTLEGEKFYGYGPICAEFDDVTGDLIRFKRTDS